MESSEHTHVLIIGAGQSGLALGYHLQRQGRQVLLVDRNQRVGDSWRARWDSLKLYSPASRDGLPGMPFPAGKTSYPTKGEMADYLEAYAERFELPVRLGTAVEALTQEDGRFVADTGDSRIEAEAVVVASGVFEKPQLPAFADQLSPTITQLHSSAYRNLSQLQDGPVLVVGASHSGADIAYEAASRHEVVLSGRDTGQLPASVETRRGRMLFRGLFFAGTHVLTVDTPMGRKMRPHIRHGGAPLLRFRRSDLRRAGVERVLERTAGVEDGLPVLDERTRPRRPERRLVHRIPSGLRLDPAPARDRRRRLSGAVPRCEHHARSLLRGPAVPALVRLDADRRRGARRRARRGADHDGSEVAPLPRLERRDRRGRGGRALIVDFGARLGAGPGPGSGGAPTA